jgi:hypothetical protein
MSQDYNELNLKYDEETMHIPIYYDWFLLDILNLAEKRVKQEWAAEDYRDFIKFKKYIVDICDRNYDKNGN